MILWLLSQAREIMAENQVVGLESDESDSDDDCESEAAKVEIGDNYAVFTDDLENGGPFFIVLCNKPLHRCEATFYDGYGNTWYEGDMILGGVWYKCMTGHRGRNPSYALCKDDPPAFTYSHLVVGSKFGMLPNATTKGNPRYSLPQEVRENLLAIIEDRF